MYIYIKYITGAGELDGDLSEGGPIISLAYEP